MKVFNLMVLSLAFAMVSILTICVLGEYLLGDNAKYIVLPIAPVLGFYSRRIVQKVLGYTLDEAHQEDVNGTK